MSSFPLTNSIIFQDGFCTTKQIWSSLSSTSRGFQAKVAEIWAEELVPRFFIGKPPFFVLGNWETTGYDGGLEVLGPEKLWIDQRFYPLVICYIATENGPFIVDLPIKNGDFP